MSNEVASPNQTWTILKLLRWTTSYFERHNVDHPRPAAEILLAHTLHYQRIDLYLHYDQPLSAQELSYYKNLIKRRVSGEPVAYIVGYREFWSLNFKITADVLIPRPETEYLVEKVLDQMVPHIANSSVRVLELGTGSGVISVALASERPQWQYWASDLSVKAVTMAQYNAIQNYVQEQILFFAGHWFDPISSADNLRFDLIVSNPPYIRSHDINNLQIEIKKFEPPLALDGGSDGLSCLNHIILDGADYLKPSGLLMLEIGDGQRTDVETIAAQCKAFNDIDFFKDYSGHDRVACLYKK